MNILLRFDVIQYCPLKEAGKTASLVPFNGPKSLFEFSEKKINRPFSKMAAEILCKSKIKTNTSARKSTLTLVTLPSFELPGEISAEKM